MSNVRDLILKIKKLQELAAQEAKKSSYQSLKKSPQSATKVNLNPEHGKKIESDLEKNRDSEDDYVYHSTYLKNLKSIAQHGLGSYGTHKIKRAWPGIQDPNHTYLATDPDVAHDYSEVSDFASDSDIDNIVTFRIHKKHLHPDHIHPDRNDSSSENIAYSKQIPPEHLEIHYDNTENGNANKLWQKHLNLRRAQATKKQELEKDAIPGGLADNKKLSDSDSKELEEGTRVEMEHTSDPEIAQEIAQDHLTEDPLYYQKLKTIEKKTLEKGARGDWKKEGYTFEHKVYNAQNPQDPNLRHRDDMQSHHIHVFDKNGKPAGSFSFHQWLEGKNKGTVQPWHADVKPEHRRKGIASEAYKMVERHTGTKMSRGDFQSPAAKKLWSAADRKFGKTEVIISIYEEEPLEKAEEFPTGPRQTHSTKGYQSARWNNEWVWQHGPEIASNHDRYINDPKLIRSMINKMPTPQHKKAMEVVIQRIQNDPNRHVIPTHDREKNRHILRARHLKSLLLNDDNFNIDTSKPNQLKITAKQRHGLATGPTDFIFNIKESPNVQKSIRDDQGRDQVRSGSLRPGFGHDLEPGRDPGSDVNPSGTGSNPGRRNAELNLLQHLLEDKRPHWSKAYHDHKHLVTPYVKEDQSKYLKNKPISDIMVRHSGSHVHESLNNRNSPEGQLVIKMLEEGQLRYHPKTGFLLNNFRTATENLQRSESAPVNLIHFSRVKGLKSIDPHYMGTGAPSQETRHGVPEVRSSYFYRADSEPEHLVTQGAVSKYHVTLPETHKLYDLANDHEGHIKSAVEANNGAYNSDMVLGKIRDAGYHGFYNSKSSLPNVVALFHSTPVHREEMP